MSLLFTYVIGIKDFIFFLIIVKYDVLKNIMKYWYIQMYYIYVVLLIE